MSSYNRTQLISVETHFFRITALSTEACFFTYDSALGRASQVVLVVKNSPANAGDRRDAGLISGSGRSPGEGNNNTLQYTCLGNPMDRGAQTGLQSMGLQRIR